MIQGCELDQDTAEISGFAYYGYDGDDLVSLDLKNLTWIPMKPEAVVIKQNWDQDKALINEAATLFTQIYLDWLKIYLNYETGSQMRTGKTL